MTAQPTQPTKPTKFEIIQWGYIMTEGSDERPDFDEAYRLAFEAIGNAAELTPAELKDAKAAFKAEFKRR